MILVKVSDISGNPILSNSQTCTASVLRLSTDDCQFSLSDLSSRMGGHVDTMMVLNVAIVVCMLGLWWQCCLPLPGVHCAMCLVR